MIAHVLAHVRSKLGRGLLLVMPLLITIWLLSFLVELVNETVTPWVKQALDWAGLSGPERLFPQLGIPLIGLVLTFTAIYLLGLLAGNLIGRKVVSHVEGLILRIPMVKWIYGSSRQLLDAFSLTGTRAFSKVVLLEYPRRQLWTVGFVTSDVEHLLYSREAEDPLRAVPVFLATTPNPTSGWMILVPISDLRVLDMTVEEAIKLIVSGGIVSPDDLGSLAREWPATLDGEAG